MIPNSLKTSKIVSFPHQERNVGGIDRVLLIATVWVKTLREPSNEYDIVEATDFVLADGEVPILFEVDPAYTTFVESESETRHGALYRVMATIELPKDRANLKKWVSDYRHVRWLAVIEYRNGDRRLAGTMEQPLRLTTTNTPGVGRRGRNNRAFMLMADVTTPAYFLGEKTSYVIGDTPNDPNPAVFEFKNLGKLLHVYTYIFEGDAYNLPLEDGFVADLSKKVALLSVSLNGVVLNGTLSSWAAFPVFGVDFEDFVVSRNTVSRVFFNPSTVHFANENILKLLVMVS